MAENRNNTAAAANQPQQPPPLPPPQPQPHPVLEQLPGVQYCINSPPPFLESIFLGFQHYVLSLGSIVLIPSITVPQMGGSDREKAKVKQTLLFLSGVNTLFQSFFGTRLPVIIGVSHSFLIPVTTILRSRQYQMINQPEERFAQTMREIQGALIITSSFQMIIGFIGLWRNIIRLFSPLSMVPPVLFTSLGFYHLGFPLIAKCVEVGIPELVFMIIISQSQYLPRFIKLKRAICDRFAVLLSIAIVWIYTGILTWSGAYHKPSKDSCRTDRSGLITGAPWIYVPFPFQWGPPTFEAGEIFATMMASFVASIETGVFLAAARYGSATPIPPSVISCGVEWLGVGTLLNGLFGSVTGASATTENAGLLAPTKAGSRRVVQISTVFMIFFSFVGKFGAIFASIPLPIMAAIYCICFGYVVSVSAGFGFLQFCNLNNFRTKLVLGFSVFMGLSLSQHFREYHLHSSTGPIHTRATWFNDIMCVLLMSPATVAAIIALALDRSLPHGKDEACKDNGAYWWEGFMVYDKDIRNNEFYRLPGKLNNLFPAF